MLEQQLTFKAAVGLVFHCLSVTTSVWNFVFFFFSGANWNNPACSANINESTAFREAAGLLSEAAPYWAMPLYSESGMDLVPLGKSHQKMAPTVRHVETLWL